MSMTKLQMGIAGALAVAGATGYVVQANTNADLRREIAAIQAPSATAVAALRAENQQLATTTAEIEMLRRDDAELKQLEQRVADLKQANVEKARLAQVQAQSRGKDVVEKIRADDVKAQEEVDRMNREGNKLVEEFKALSDRAKDGAIMSDERTQADAAAKAKLTEIQNKQREVQTFVENTRRLLRGRLAAARAQYPDDPTWITPTSPSPEKFYLRDTPPADGSPANTAPAVPGTVIFVPRP